MFCPKCGASAANTASFCPKCGNRLSSPSRGVSNPVPAAPATSPAPVPGKTTSRGVLNLSGLMMNLMLVFALFFAVTLGAVVCLTSQNVYAPDRAVLRDDDAEVISIVAEGNAAYAQGDHALARDFYQHAAELYPQEGDVFCRLADTYYILEDEEMALSYYQQAMLLYEDISDMPLKSYQNFDKLTRE